VPVEPPITKPAPHPRVTPAKITTPATKTMQETPSSAPSASDVAALYGVVGRALGQLQQAKGSDATIDLWPRFRYIRINDAIVTPDSRRDTQKLLRELQRDVDARR